MEPADPDIARAFARLGLEPGASANEVRARYLREVRRWHPDHFHGDAAGVAEANATLRLLNEAYETIQAATPAAPAQIPVASADAEERSPTLSEAEKAAIVSALNDEGIEGGFARSVKHALGVGGLWLVLPMLYSQFGWTLASGVLEGRQVLIPLVAAIWMLLGVRVFGWIQAIFGLVFLPLVMEIAARLANGGPLPW